MKQFLTILGFLLCSLYCNAQVSKIYDELVARRNMCKLSEIDYYNFEINFNTNNSFYNISQNLRQKDFAK